MQYISEERFQIVTTKKDEVYNLGRVESICYRTLSVQSPGEVY